MHTFWASLEKSKELVTLDPNTQVASPWRATWQCPHVGECSLSYILTSAAASFMTRKLRRCWRLRRVKPRKSESYLIIKCDLVPSLAVLGCPATSFYLSKFSKLLVLQSCSVFLPSALSKTSACVHDPETPSERCFLACPAPAYSSTSSGRKHKVLLHRYMKFLPLIYVSSMYMHLF